MPASRSFLRWWERVGWEMSNSDELADADLAGVLAQDVDELQAHRVAHRLGDFGHPQRSCGVDVGIDDGFATWLSGGSLLLRSELQIIATYLRLSI